MNVHILLVVLRRCDGRGQCLTAPVYTVNAVCARVRVGDV